MKPTKDNNKPEISRKEALKKLEIMVNIQRSPH